MTATWTGWPAAYRPLATGHVVVATGGKGVGGGEEARGITGRGIRRMSINAGRCKAGWTRLRVGGRKRKSAESAAGTVSDGRRPATGRLRGGCPPIAFQRGGSLLLPPGDFHVPVDSDGLDGGNKK